MLSFEYKEGVKREIISALNKVIGPMYPDADKGKIHVSLEWPIQEVQLPAIYVTFQEANLRNAGIGHYEIKDVAGIDQQFKHWVFDGGINFNVLALTPLDRDRVSGGLLNLLAFGNLMPEFQPFFQDIHDYDWVGLQLMSDEIFPGGEQVVDVPWGPSDRERIYTNTYQVKLFGEFFSNVTTGELIRIDAVNVYPYGPGDPVPQGTSDPAEWF